MKNSIKLTALFLLASTGVFVATSAKAAVVPSKADVITFSSLPSERGIAVKVEKTAPGKAIVAIYDQDGNVLRKDIVKSDKAFDKAYILNQLENGDYTIEVTSHGQVVTKDIHVYDENGTKMFIVNE
ncbi:MAG TPA: hypothetical protein VGN20_07160 [Mucilaginibacter sp.]|jgi:hypothetical protein